MDEVPDLRREKNDSMSGPDSERASAAIVGGGAFGIASGLEQTATLPIMFRLKHLTWTMGRNNGKEVSPASN
jgi:hypothetical protein